MQNRLLRAVAVALARVHGRVFLAVSGGLDSMVLLEAVARARDSGLLREGIDLHIAHVNHGLRGRASDADERLVRATAVRHRMEFHSIRRSDLKGQLACRNARIQFLDGLAADSSDRVVTAHQLDDQAETVLLRLLRGTGVRGLASMPKSGGKRLRPLLEFSRLELAKVAREWDVRWREDSSNRSTHYDRNWIRLSILPQLEARRPGAGRRIAALADDAAALPSETVVADSFAWEGVRFYRGLTGTTAGLGREFSLDRKHARELFRLLEKGRGVLTAEGARFTLSCCVLLVEREAAMAGSVRFDAGRWTSPLGSWAIDRPLLQRGESWKKRCQEAGVPIFFRTWLPWVELHGKKTLLSPGTVFSPSLLGDWFFNPCGRNDARVAISRSETRQVPPPP